MIRKLHIEGFKGWKDTKEIELAPITVLFGGNSSGKSSIGQFLVMLKQTIQQSDRKTVLMLGGDKSSVNLGTPIDIFYNQGALGGFNMQITDVRVRKVTKEGKMKAVVSITLDNEFVVHDIKVIEGEKGLFIAMPSRKAADGEYRDIAHPINSETRERIQSIILEKYEIAALESEEEAAL